MKPKLNMLMLALVATLHFACTKHQTEQLVPKTADQDPAIPSLVINGARLHTEAFGHPDSTLVICLHSGPGGDYRDLLNAKDLANEGYRVVFYDQRGSGLSQRFPEKFYTRLGKDALNLMYDDLAAVIAHYRTHNKQKVYLLGQSWGGMLATGFAGRYPDAIQGLVVAEPGGFIWEDIKQYTTNSRSFSLWSEALNDAAYIDQFLSGKEDDHELLDYKAAMISANNEITGEDNTATGSFWRPGAVISVAMARIGKDHQPSFSEGIDSFDVPVLFLHSEKNRAYTAAWAQKISAVFQSPQLFHVTGVGHVGMLKDRAAWTQKTMPRILQYFNSL